METNKQNEHNAANDGLLLPLDDDMINTAWDIPTLTFSDIFDIDRKPAVSPMSAVPQPVTTTPPVPQLTEPSSRRSRYNDHTSADAAACTAAAGPTVARCITAATAERRFDNASRHAADSFRK